MHKFVLRLALVIAVPTAAGAEDLLLVDTVVAHAAPQIESYDITGAIAASENIPISFRSGGRVVSIEVDVGDHVDAGSMLASLDPTQAKAVAQAAVAQLAAADAALTRAQQAQTRASDLLERGAGTRADLDSANEALLSAQSSSDQARAQLAKAQQGVEDTQLRASVAGIVTKRNAQPGQIVGAAQPILTLARDGDRKAIFHVPNVTDLNRFVGREVAIKSLDSEGQSFKAEVSEISPLADANTGTVEVKAQLLSDGDRQPGLGTPVSTSIAVKEGPVIALPWTVLAVKEDGPAVWTVDPQSHVVSLNPVTLSRYTSDKVEISSGVAEGDIVVTKGAHLLFPGRVVKIAGAVK